MAQTVRRALEVMELLAKQPQTLGSLAEALDVHRSTALRLLQTLNEGGFARKLPDGSYSLGYRTLGLALRAQEQFSLRTIAHPHLVRLSEETRCTTHLAAVEDNHIIYVDKVEPSDSPRMMSQIGRPVPLHTAGAAKAILAFTNAETKQKLLTGWDFTAYTATTLSNSEALSDELTKTRARGYGVDNGEFEDYVNCIAMPVHDASAEVSCSISITALCIIKNLDDLLEYLPSLRSAADAISRDLGWLPEKETT